MIALSVVGLVLAYLIVGALTARVIDADEFRPSSADAAMGWLIVLWPVAWAAMLVWFVSCCLRRLAGGVDDSDDLWSHPARLCDTDDCCARHTP